MTLKDLMDKTGMRLLTKEAPLQREVTTGYSCDLLSWVLAHGQAGMAWITVQTHLNVIAVAMLMDMACVIIPEGIVLEEAYFVQPHQTCFQTSGKYLVVDLFLQMHLI